LAFKAVGIELQWHGEGEGEYAINAANRKTVVKVDSQFFRPAEVEILIGNPAKAEVTLGWKREVSFLQLVERMVKADIQRIAMEK
jgi:GDPmannose 4,6-dehydratase